MVSCNMHTLLKLLICWRREEKLWYFRWIKSDIHTCPPAAQAATKPKWPPSLMSRFAAVVTNLTPVAPNGCPIDSEPPHELNFSSGGAPN